jgi:hypothetical protein
MRHFLLMTADPEFARRIPSFLSLSSSSRSTNLIPFLPPPNQYLGVQTKVRRH